MVVSPFIWKWMKLKKVLVVLDDVSELEQIEHLIGKQDLYAPGSRVIMTSRDNQILVNGGADEIYEPEFLNYGEALQLLSLHAFKKSSPVEGYMGLAADILKYADGNPLALKVLGSTLHNKNFREWEDQLNKLEAMADHKIQNILRISYDELDYMEKEIFLDIACFFKEEDRDHVECVLQACGLNAKIGIAILLDKALVTISKNKLCMHNLLQQMGREIVRKECIEKPWNRSHLWVAQDIYKLLTDDLGEVSVKSIVLDISKVGDINLSPTAFTRMKRLRLLKVYNPYYPDKMTQTFHNGVIKIKQARYLVWHQHSRGLAFLPDELRYLYWYGYPSDSLPLKFCPQNLVQLYLIHSHVKELCDKNQFFGSLKLMDLSYSVKLIKIADLSRFPELEVLCLRGCTSLVEIRSTRLYDTELRHLNLESCKSLCHFLSFLHMEHLDFLSLEDCSKLKEFLKIPKSLRCLILSKTAVKQVPPSIQHCYRLTELKLESCTSLCVLPDTVCNLKSLKSLSIKECHNMKELPNKIENLISLEKLDASRSGIKILPSSINWLMKLEFMSCRGCNDLVLPSFSGLPSLEKLLLDDCGLSEIPDSIGSLGSLSDLFLDGNNLKKLPVTIKQLPKLKRLYLRDNRRLECIPELPSSLQDLSVQSCSRLESLPAITELSWNALFSLHVGNCISMDRRWCEKLMDDFLMAIENKLPRLRYIRLCDEELLEGVYVFQLNVGLSIVGDELPPRMKHKNNKGSTIIFSMESSPLDSIVVVFSAVVASTDGSAETCETGSLKCEICFVTDSGLSSKLTCGRLVINGDPHSKPTLAMTSENNLLWVYKFQFIVSTG